MKRTGLLFYVTGQYVTESDYDPCLDPNDQNWTPFNNPDIHPFDKPFFTLWSQFTNPTEEEVQALTQAAINLIDWLRHERDWFGFDASLWLYQGEDTLAKRLYRWELC